jgi:hypothetical protein
VDAVRKMLETMRDDDYDKGFLVGKRFTEAAELEMTEKNIQRISDDYMPPVSPERLFFTINEQVNGLCKTKCGKVPLTESDCDGYASGESCNIRIVSDNASFHFERGWITLLKNDFKKLSSIHDSINGHSA